MGRRGRDRPWYMDETMWYYGLDNFFNSWEVGLMNEQSMKKTAQRFSDQLCICLPVVFSFSSLKRRDINVMLDMPVISWRKDMHENRWDTAYMCECQWAAHTSVPEVMQMVLIHTFDVTFRAILLYDNWNGLVVGKWQLHCRVDTCAIWHWF